MLCTDPVFPYDPERGWYENCSTCGRYAWGHEQSNVVADMQAMWQWWRDGAPGQMPAPHMKPIPVKETL